VASHYVLLAAGKGGFLLLDDRAYDKVGWTLARVWMGIFPGIRDTDQYLMVNFTYLVAAVYYLLGHSLLAAKMLNVAFGSLTAVAVYGLGSEIFDRRVARLGAVLVVVFPSLIMWSAINLKDILVVFLTTVAVYGLVRFARRHDWWALALTLGATLLIENLRQFVFFILVWSMPIAFLFTDRSRWRRKLILVLPLIVGLASLSYVTSNEKFGTNFLSPKALTEAEWKRWLEERDAQTGINEDSIKPPRDMETIVERSVAYLPRGVFYVIFGPTPWEARSGAARAVIPEMLAWYGILATAVLGLVLVFRRSWRDLVLPGGFTLAWMLALALTEGNTGNIFRHRSQFMPFVFLIAAVGLSWLWSRWELRRTNFSLDSATARARSSRGAY
jgi:4-amino-4-deoxy-L-arabinose transferase-like glycosyltransferase